MPLRNSRMKHTVRVMEGIKLLFVVVFALGVERTYAQQASNFRILTGSEARDQDLGQNPELFDFAALTGETVFINITETGDPLVVLQEDVNAIFDCLPFLILSRFPGGQITWWMRGIDLEGNVQPGPETQIMSTDTTDRVYIGGQYNRFLNITRTVVFSSQEDPDFGIYTCRVCVGEGALQMCQDANTTVYLLGSPPDVDCGEPNDGTACVFVRACARSCVPVCVCVCGGGGEKRCNMYSASMNRFSP